MDEIDTQFVDLIKDIRKSNNFDDLTSTLCAILYIEPGEIAMEDLAQITGYSLASISNKVRILEPHGLIKRQVRPGSRKIYFSMEKNLLIFMADLFAGAQLKLATAKQKMPNIIMEYKRKAKTEKQKLKVMENYYKYVLELDSIMQSLLEKIQ